MDYSSNHKQTIIHNTISTMNSLKQIYIDINALKNRAFYKEITRFYSAIAIIINTLKINEHREPNRILLDNILLNFCSLIHCVVLRDTKLINFIYRNIIESIIRYLTNNLTSHDLDSLFKILTTYPSDGFTGPNLVQKYGGQLKDIYTRNCLYVHTDTSKIPTNLVNLSDYKNHINDCEMSVLLNDFKMLNFAIITLFKVFYKNLYINTPINQKSYIDDLTPLGYRVEYQNFLHDSIQPRL